tara:strand:- start:4550 stop:4984 length:435 start_codon:yes stop_codon:yes gene_type:complete
MALNHPKAGPNSVPAYIMSGVPYVTQSVSGEVPRCDGGGSPSTLKHSFPFVTKFFQVENLSSTRVLRVGFSDLGVKGSVTNNFIEIAASGKSEVFELRCKEIFLGSVAGTGAARIVAGLTTIQQGEFPILTGSVDGIAAFEGVG